MALGIQVSQVVLEFLVPNQVSAHATASVDCSITIAPGLGSIRITLRGVKLRPICEPDQDGAAVPEISSVPRAV